MTNAPILRPTCATDVVAALADARAQGRKVEIRGGGTKAGIGTPDRDALILDMTGFSGVIDYDPPELVLTAYAGTPLADVMALVQAKGQMLAFEPMIDGPLSTESGTPTLGGAIASAIAGPRRLSAGAARDHFLGFAGVSGRGEAFKAGGKVVKNVTGYDLAKVMAGSWGQLVALTEVTVKVLPRPRSSATLVLHGLTDADAAGAMAKALGAPCDVSAASHLPGGVWQTQAATLLRLEGIEPSIAARIAALRACLGAEHHSDVLNDSDSRALWQKIAAVTPLLPAGDDRLLWRLSLPPADAWRAVAALAPLGGHCFYDWAGGLVWLSLPLADHGHAPAVRHAAESVGGHAMLVRAPTAVRAAVPAFHPEAPGVAMLARRVRAAFDPAGLFATGRFDAAEG